ncbi:hypothetical protein LINGRAHAP2_LOCUS15664 [Linum grandiflorum]
MRELVETNRVHKGNFKKTNLKELLRMLHAKVANCTFMATHIKSNVRYFKEKFVAFLELKQASGMTWDDLCFIFGLDQAVAADAVQPSDAASKLVAGDGVSDYMEMGAERVDLYTIPADMDHDDVMADLINQGIDLDATGLKDVEAEITSKRVQMKGKQAASSSGSKRSRQQFSEDNYCQIVASISAANENLEKIATNYCIEVDLAVKRQPIPRAFEVH